mmetsp:Transcript_19008/g.49019  ORF Transcript_19008/g.49019 Transcript_19008/m.49019 type:complete len:311 (-) Transcript_19008:311-1243(-)
MGNIFGRAEIDRLQGELESVQQALEQERQRAAAQLEAEQRRRAAAQAELSACSSTAASLRTELEAVQHEEQQAREAAAAARKAHDEHALLVKRILTAQQEHGVRASLAGVPSPAAAAERIARAASEGALSRVDATAARALEAPAEVARMLADRERDEERATLLGAGIGAEGAGFGDVSVEFRGIATSAILGLSMRNAASAGLSSNPFDAARVGAGIMHRLSFGALGASAIYDPVAKSIDEARVSLMMVPPPADPTAQPGARLLASMDHTGELSLAHSWRMRALTLKTNLGIDVNKSAISKYGAHVTVHMH